MAVGARRTTAGAGLRGPLTPGPAAGMAASLWMGDVSEGGRLGRTRRNLGATREEGSEGEESIDPTSEWAGELFRVTQEEWSEQVGEGKGSVTGEGSRLGSWKGKRRSLRTGMGGIPRIERRCGSRTGGLEFLNPTGRLPKGSRFKGEGRKGLGTPELGFRLLCR